MSRVDRLRHESVDFVPERLTPGVIYVSRRFSTASHLCCCGCGLEVVTPLNSAKWRLSESMAGVSMHPSVGNWSFPCRSHYWIEEGRVLWAGAMSSRSIAKVRRGDRRDADALAAVGRGRLDTLVRATAVMWARGLGQLRRWLGQ